MSHLEGRPSLAAMAGNLGPILTAPRPHRGITDNPEEAGLPSTVMSWPLLLQEPSRLDPAKAKTRRQRQPRAGSAGVGGRWPFPRPCPGLSPLGPCPPPTPPRRCGGAASCTTVTAAPVSTGRAPRSCCWRRCCCWAATGASRPAGTWLLPGLSYPRLWAFPLLPRPSLPSHLRHPRGGGLLPRNCPTAGA